MNDLQLTLLIVGGGGIAAMIAYNWWQDYRLRNQASERFGQTDEDPLLNTGVAKSGFERFEPGFSGWSRPDSDFSFDEAADDSSSEMPLNDNNLQNELQITIDNRLFADFIVRHDEEKDAN